MNLVHALYEPRGDAAHPTVVALHGWGASGLDLLGLAPYLAGGRFRVLCPQGSVEVPLGPMAGYGWFPLTPGVTADPADVSKGVDEVRRFLDAARRRHAIDPKTLVLLGFSQGGVIAYALALAEPDRFAGLVVLSSWLPEPLVRTLPPRSREHLPTLVHHGAGDELIDVARGRESVETLRRLQVPVTYREFDMGHEINAASLNDLSGWLAEKVLSPIVLVR